MSTSHPRRFRRQATGASLIAFPLLMFIPALIQPTLGDQPTQVYDAAVGQSARLVSSVAIGLPGVLLWIVAVAGAVHLAQPRAVKLGHIGGGLALLGALGHMVNATLLLVLAGLPRAADRTVLIPALDRIAKHVFPVALPMLVLGGLGLVLLAFALNRAGRAPTATPVLVLLAFVSEFAPLPGRAPDLVLWALAGTGLGLAGLAVLRMDDTTWEHPRGAQDTLAPHLNDSDLATTAAKA